MIMTLEKIRIRKAGIKDAAHIADLSRKTFYESVGKFNSRQNMDRFMNEQFSRDKLMAEVGEKHHIFLLAYLDDQLSAYVKLRENKPPDTLNKLNTIEIARIYVAQHAIGHGLGKALMKRCLDIARARNKEVIWLGVWEQNQNAISFYSHCGFERFGEHIFMLGDDPQTDWLMKKSL
jgi:ribosomal protein S18 acetylase RimI-like enzyme